MESDNASVSYAVRVPGRLTETAWANPISTSGLRSGVIISNFLIQIRTGTLSKYVERVPSVPRIWSLVA